MVRLHLEVPIKIWSKFDNFLIRTLVLSRACSDKKNRVCEYPSRNELKQLIRAMPFTTIAKQFGVSDNAVRKWCDKYGLPRKVTEIKKNI